MSTVNCSTCGEAMEIPVEQRGDPIVPPICDLCKKRLNESARKRLKPRWWEFWKRF